jgi:hypothetical protein
MGETLTIAPGFNVEYIEHVYEEAEADALLDEFLRLPMTPEVIRMYGRDTVTNG